MWLSEFDASPWLLEPAIGATPASQRPVESDSSVPEREAKASRANALAVRRRRAYRSRKRSEASELRAASASLAKARDALAQRAQGRTRELLRALGAKRFGGGWRGIAARQLQRRVGAERCNRELRAQLRQSREIAQQLVELVVASLSLVDTRRLSALLHFPPPKQTLQFSERDMATVRALTAEVAAIRSQAEVVLSRCTLPAIASSEAYGYSLDWLRDAESSREVAEIVEARRVAFDFDVAIAALEETVAKMLGVQSEPAMLRLPGGVIALKFGLSCVDDEGQSRRLESVYVGQMAVHGGRASLCWRCESREPATSGRFHETGWGMAQRAAESGTSFTYFTRLEAPSTKEQEQEQATRGADLKQFMTMTPSIEEETVTWYRAMESVVLRCDGLSTQGARASML